MPFLISLIVSFDTSTGFPPAELIREISLSSILLENMESYFLQKFLAAFQHVFIHGIKDLDADDGIEQSVQYRSGSFLWEALSIRIREEWMPKAMRLIFYIS